MIAAVLLTLIGTATSQQPSAAAAVSPAELARIWDAERVSSPVSPLVDHREVVRRIDDLPRAAPGLFHVEKAGESLEGRAIYHVRAGSGPYAVLLWSQMHGDEPTATSALFDVFEYLRRHRSDPAVARILSSLTIHAVPMLNPDGAERFQRRNAQSIDVNRDALRLQTPEGKVLKALRDRLRPAIGFNLHNQGWRTSVGDPPKPASISLLSVAHDAARTESEGRRLTKKVCAVIRDAVEPFAAGQIGRYDDEFEVRAFGDNITLWGTPVVLIETGPWPSAEPDPPLVRLNFIAIVSALDALASGDVARADPRRYETLPMNETRMLYLVIRNATVINGSGAPPFTADLGIVASRRIREEQGRRDVQLSLAIDDIGDLRTLGALTTVDATGMTVMPLPPPNSPNAAVFQPGAVVDLPEWRAAHPSPIAVGQPAQFAVLKPATEAGKYVVERIVR